jgi:hypothetical protein
LEKEEKLKMIVIHIGWHLKKATAGEVGEETQQTR